MGNHSPAKNIIGKNSSEPMIPAIRADGASAETSVPSPSIAAVPSTIASTKPPSSLGSGTEKAIRVLSGAGRLDADGHFAASSAAVTVSSSSFQETMNLSTPSFSSSSVTSSYEMPCSAMASSTALAAA